MKSLAIFSYRTPLCVLYPSRIIAAACYILAQQYLDIPSGLSLAARISSPAPSASLPTPPSHKPPYPESARFVVDFFRFNEMELSSLSGKYHARLNYARLNYARLIFSHAEQQYPRDIGDSPRVLRCPRCKRLRRVGHVRCSGTLHIFLTEKASIQLFLDCATGSGSTSGEALPAVHGDGARNPEGTVTTGTDRSSCS